MMTITHIRAYPKINISLKIQKAKNGMHPLLSRFMLAIGDLYDDMFFAFLDSKNKKNVLCDKSLACKDGLFLSGKFNCNIESNLIYKAYKILNIKREIYIKIKKNIPFGAGLGGGSVNAAISLLALNEMCNLNLSLESLLDFGKKLGSDVPFFIIIYTQNTNNLLLFKNNFLGDINEINLDSKTHFNLKNNLFFSANVSGVGENIVPFFEDFLPFRIFCNDISCDTGAVYREFDKLLENLDSNISFKKSYETNINLSLESRQILSQFSMQELNDLFIPALHLYPHLAHFKQELSKEKKIFFSGSGSSFFGIVN